MSGERGGTQAESGDAGLQEDAGFVLIEFEHAVVRRAAGRPLPFSEDVGGSTGDFYSRCAQASVSSIGNLFRDIHFDRYSILVNRRIVKQQDWDVVPVKFPAPLGEETLCNILPGGRSGEAAGLDHGIDVAHNRRPPNARYPRLGSFEVSIYDTGRAEHRVLFSKYRENRLPTESADLARSLLPFLLVFAGRSDDEELLNRISSYAIDAKIPLALSCEDVRRFRGESLLLAEICDAMNDLQEAVEAGDPGMIGEAVEAMPQGLWTLGVVEAERRAEALAALATAIEEALATIEQGFVTCGVEQLRLAVGRGKAGGLAGSAMMQGDEYLKLAEREEVQTDLFSIIDVDNSGSITRSEFEHSVVQLVQAAVSAELAAGQGPAHTVSGSALAAATLRLEACERRVVRPSLNISRPPSNSRRRLTQRMSLSSTMRSPSKSSTRSGAQTPDRSGAAGQPGELEEIRALLRQKAQELEVDIDLDSADQPAKLQRCLEAIFGKLKLQRCVGGDRDLEKTPETVATVVNSAAVAPAHLADETTDMPAILPDDMEGIAARKHLYTTYLRVLELSPTDVFALTILASLLRPGECVTVAGREFTRIDLLARRLELAAESPEAYLDLGSALLDGNGLAEDGPVMSVAVGGERRSAKELLVRAVELDSARPRACRALLSAWAPGETVLISGRRCGESDLAERLRELEAAAKACACGAVFGHGAAFCHRCGAARPAAPHSDAVEVVPARGVQPLVAASVFDALTPVV